jgi:hypothetical protein
VTSYAQATVKPAIFAAAKPAGAIFRPIANTLIVPAVTIPAFGSANSEPADAGRAVPAVAHDVVLQSSGSGGLVRLKAAGVSGWLSRPGIWQRAVHKPGAAEQAVDAVFAELKTSFV